MCKGLFTSLMGLKLISCLFGWEKDYFLSKTIMHLAKKFAFTTIKDFAFKIIDYSIRTSISLFISNK